MAVNLITNTINMNYLYSALTTTLVKSPSILRNGISNLTPIVNSCIHSGWDDFRNDGMRYIFFFNFKLEDFVVGSVDTVINSEIISHCSLQHNYQCPLIKSVNGQQLPITLKNIIDNPLSKNSYSLHTGTNGNSLYEYAIVIRNAHVQNISQCPIDVRLINYNHPFYYEIVYNLITSNGLQTVKRSIVVLIKYKKTDGSDFIAFLGTAIQEFIVEGQN